MSVAFVEAFSAELAKAPKKIPDSHEGTRERPLTLPEMPVAYVAPQAVQPKKVDVTLKSIRSPRFSVNYQINDTDSVFAVKERLVSDPNGPFASVKTSVGAIRLVLQGRALSDTHQLRELPSHSLIAMVKSEAAEDTIGPPVQFYWGEEDAEIETVSKTPSSEKHATTRNTDEKATKSGINASFWNEVEKLAARYCDNSTEMVKMMRQSYEDSKRSSTYDLD